MSLVCFSGVFQHQSIKHQWGQWSYNYYVSLYLLSHLVPCFLLYICFVRLSLYPLKSLPVFLLLFRKIGLPIKCSFWLKLSFFYFKIFLLTLDVVNLCIYVITKRPLWLVLAHLLQEDISQSNFSPPYGVCFLVWIT